MWWIRQAVGRAVADHARTIRLPVHLLDQINHLARVSRELTLELGREPTSAEIALASDLIDESDREQIQARLSKGKRLSSRQARVLRQKTRKVRYILALEQEPAGLDTPVGDEDNSVLADFVPNEFRDAPFESTAQVLLKEDVARVLVGLSERQREVIILRFGLRDGESHTLEEIGQQYGVTRERIRQIEAKALRLLRHPVRSKILRDYLKPSTPKRQDAST